MDASRLAEVLGSFADILPMGARVFLFAKLLEGLTDEELTLTLTLTLI